MIVSSSRRPAGMMSALFAARRAWVTLFERNEKLGKSSISPAKAAAT
jgi:predicted flavoprotein YhiN